MATVSKALADAAAIAVLLGSETAPAQSPDPLAIMALNFRLGANGYTGDSKELDDLNGQIATAYENGNCVRFDILRRRLWDSRVNKTGPLQNAVELSVKFWGEKKCTTQTQRRTYAEIAFGVDIHRLLLPQVQAGTHVAGGAGTEAAILKSNKNLSGERGAFAFQVPMQNVLWGDYFYIRSTYGEADGTTQGGVPIGGGNVAQTYIIPNPGNGSTGIALGNTGQNVIIHTEGRAFDAVFGVESRRPLNVEWYFSDPRATGPIPHVTTGIGLRYGYSTLKHNIGQSSPTFAGINSDTNLEINSHFVAANFSTGIDMAAAGRTGFFGGASLFVAPGALNTDARATQNSRCDLCPAAERNISLGTGYNDTSFAVMAGANARIGYKFNPAFSVQVEGGYQYMTRADLFFVPIAPTQQPIGPSHGSSSSGYVGARMSLGMNASDWF